MVNSDPFSPNRRVFYPGISLERGVAIPMSDRIKLCSDIYRPNSTQEKLPILLMRLPYGRDIASTVAYRHPSWYAQQGYIVVIQEVRGCGNSEGEFYPFRSEYGDTVDTIEWCISEIPKNNGKLGMYGFSYQGVVQFQGAVMQPKGLVTICPAMASADLFEGWFYWGGALCWEFVFTWALQLAQIKTTESLELWQAQQNIPNLVRSVLARHFPLLTENSANQFYLDWLNWRSFEQWQSIHPIHLFDRFDLPALHIGGWYDPFITGIWQTYRRACEVTKQPQKLIIGPWKHFPWRRRVGEIDFGREAERSVDEIQIDWFDFWLKDKDNGIVQKERQTFFLMGKNEWLTEDERQNKEELIYFLNTDRVLATTRSMDSLPNIYVYEPYNPTPSTEYLPVNQRQINDRWDCLTFRSDVLQADYPIGGIVKCHLVAATNAPDTDWVLKLLDIYPDDREMLVTMGVLRASYGGKKPTDLDQFSYDIQFRPTYHSFAAGHQIGLTVSSAAFPLIERHSNTAQEPSSTHPKEWQASTQLIFPESYLSLPLILLNKP